MAFDAMDCKMAERYCQKRYISPEEYFNKICQLLEERVYTQHRRVNKEVLLRSGKSRQRKRIQLRKKGIIK